MASTGAPAVSNLTSLTDGQSTAHLQSRRADSMLKNKKLEEAMICHRKAAEFLLQAMDSTTSKYAQESMQAQHQYHLRQQDLLQLTLLKFQTPTPKNSHKKTVHNKATQTEQADLQFTFNHFQSSDGPLQTVPGENRVFHAMSETDSILGYLVHKSRYTSGGEINIGSDSVSYKSHTRLKRGTMSKFPRDDSAVLEELTVQNSELRRQISDLIRQLDDAKKDKQYMEDKVLRTGSSQQLFSNCDNHDVIPDMDLPPLEMPHFDFESLQGSTQDSVHYDQEGMIFNGD